MAKRPDEAMDISHDHKMVDIRQFERWRAHFRTCTRF